MALNFPSSPTSGQVFENWIYSSTKGAWEAKPLDSAKTVTSDIAPINADDGDQWFNTNDGTLYIYVVDVDGGQWVESQAPITANGYYSPNYLINGAFDIWQRGTSIAHSGGAVSVDMWRQYTDSGSGTQARDTSDFPEGLPAQSYRFTASANSTNWSFFQVIESANCSPLIGKTVTISVYLKSSVARTFRVSLGVNSTIDAGWSAAGWTTPAFQDFSVTTSWARYSFTATVPSTARTLQIGVSSNGANMASGSVIRVAGVQLEEGTIATTFRRNGNSIAEELATCERYYQRIDSSSQANRFLGSVAYYQGTLAVALVPLVTKMRTIPSVSISAANTFQVLTAQTNVTPSSVTVNANDTSPVMLVFDVTTSVITTTAAGSFRSNNTANMIIQASSEL